MKYKESLFLFILLSSNAWAIQIIEDFNNNTFQDATSTAVWNGALGYAHAPIEFGGTAIDLGNGSNGNCSFSGTVTAGTYNCLNLTLSNVNFSGSSNAVFKVLGNTTISGSVNLSSGVAGGGAGGSAVNAAASGNGSGAGAGTGGNRYAPYGINPVTGDVGGGGGGGGSNIGAATAGSAGTKNAGEFGVAGGTGGAAGASGNNAATLHTALFAGSGGGAGAVGRNNGGTDFLGVPGGAGGGVLHIASGGSINATGSVVANGGAGGSSTLGGAGGGGSGGTIFLQGLYGVVATNNLTALGGAGGTTTPSGTGEQGGAGGAGSDGAIRIDKGNFATNSITGTINPANSNNDLDFSTAGPYIIISKGYDTRGNTNVFSGYTASDYTAAGDTLLYEFSDSADNSTWSGWTTDVTSLSQRYIRFRVTITNTNTNDTSKVYSLVFEYDIITKSDYIFESEVAASCATISRVDDDKMNPWNLLFSLLVGFAFTFLLRKYPHTRN